jgi:uncharacterized protein
MRIDLERVREEPFAWSEELAIAQETLDRPEVLDLSAVHCHGRVEHVDPGFLLRAELAYSQTLACDRCLEALEQRVLAPVELVVLVAGASTEGQAPEVRERDLEERELDVLSIPDQELDTEEVVREQIQLNLPMKPLCSADCHGLCPRCGGNRNRQECSCGDEGTDPRWAALEVLRDRFPSA